MSKDVWGERAKNTDIEGWARQLDRQKWTEIEDIFWKKKEYRWTKTT
jgi:hypothetical protein